MASYSLPTFAQSISTSLFLTAAPRWRYPSLAPVASLYALSLLALCKHLSAMSADCAFDPEEALGYVLIVLGYLLLPGVGVLLVRRRNTLASHRDLLNSECIDDYKMLSQSLPVSSFALPALFSGEGSLRADVARCTHTAVQQADTEDHQCSVCLANIEIGDDVRVLPCSHVFHTCCADLWLVSSRKNSCPMCMSAVCASRDSDMLPLTSAATTVSCS